MLVAALSLLLAAAGASAAPFERRGLAQIKSNCNHDLSYSFDDGPYEHHNEILDYFDGVGGKASFFVNGMNWGCIYDQDNVDAIRRSYEEGHLIASHTWSHAALDTLTHAQIDYEIQRLDEALVKIIGVKPKFLRPPYGSINEDAASYIQNTYGKTIVLWSDDSGDSTGGSAQQSYDLYNGFAHESPRRPHMALSHETQEVAIQAIRMGTVSQLANAGINLQTVAQCTDDQNPYIHVGGYQQRDSSWVCTGAWNPTPPGNPTSTTSANPPTGTCASTYYSAAGETCTTIEQKFGLPTGSIKQYNSFVTCTDIWAGTPLCIPPGGNPPSSSTTSTTSTTSSAPPTGTCAFTYNSLAGETCTTIEQKFGLPTGAIKQYNSFVTCTDIWAGTPLCIPPGGNPPSSTTSSAPPAPTCVSTYKSVAGDTCASIGTKYGLTGNQILAANTFLNCNDIWANTNVCIPPGGSSTTCTQTISSLAGDTCDTIGSRYGVSGTQIKTWNDFLNCADIWTNTPVCVRH